MKENVQTNSPSHYIRSRHSLGTFLIGIVFISVCLIHDLFGYDFLQRMGQ